MRSHDQGNGPPNMRNFRPQPPGPGGPTPPTPVASIRWNPGCVLIVIVGVVLFAFGSTLLETVVNWQWFGSLGFQDVYGTRLSAQAGVFFAAAVITIAFTMVNWFVARRIAAPGQIFAGQQPAVPPAVVRWAALFASLLLALILGLGASDSWDTILRFGQQVPFGQQDPIFGQDIGFYVFTLPFYEFLRGWAIGLVIVTVIGAGAIYATRPSLFGSREGFHLDQRVSAHLAVLGAIFLVLIAWGYSLSAYNLLFSEHGPLYGISYTDDHARLLGYRILLVVALLAAGLLLLNLILRRWLLLVGAFGVWLVALVVVGGLYPSFVQNFQVQPNQQTLEQPYILNHIAATRAAYGLDKFNERPFDATDSPSQPDLAANQATVNNIRLWDYRPLLSVFTQLQAIRSYYVFNNVDIDRYQLAGGERQVMISARELDVTRLADQASTWQNQHLVYTHGYGAVVVPVNQIEAAGLPHLMVKDLPPVAEDPALAITEPRIYYGEAEDNYVFVDTGQQEFDYPLSGSSPISGTTSTTEGANATTTYTGTGGVKLGGFFNKLLFALYFGDGNVMLSNYVQDNTRVLFHRNFAEAQSLIAPFLRYDDDPYLAIASGKLYWIQDAFTVTDHYPYSKPINDDYNYIRNSVKIVTDAYTGAMTFYVFDPTDPIIQTYARIFPSLFHPGSEMPAAIRAHVRYPERLLNEQATMYSIFHMTDPVTFYQQEDAWKVPFGGTSDQSLPMEAYYNIMRVPGETQEEFLLMVPFTPATRQNMVAWMAAKGDAADYGRVDVIRFPKSKTYYGPEQISALINRDPQVSSDITLWNREGSNVIQGNLLVIPIANSVIYVRPLFIQSSSGGGIPGLQRVIAVVGNGVGYGADLPSALASAFIKEANGAPPPLPPIATPGPGTPVVPTPGLSTPGLGLGTPILGTPGVCTGTAATYSASALDHYQRSQDAVKRGDWTTYGAEQTALASDLTCLQQVTH